MFAFSAFNLTLPMNWIMDLKPASEYANHSAWDTDVKYAETDSRKHLTHVCVRVCVRALKDSFWHIYPVAQQVHH